VDTGFHALNPVDAAISSRFSTASAHQKCHVAYEGNNSIDRMHVQSGLGDPSTANYTVRRAGLPEPIWPTGTDVVTSGTGGYTGTRYFRYRFIFSSGGTIWRRSEPSEAYTFEPPGTGEGAVITRATLPSGETISDWEVEASDDNADFYRIATVAAATSTYFDTTNPASDYAVNGVLSEPIGDYIPAWAAKFCVVDEDRLVIAGSYVDGDLQSRVGWTPVYSEPGVGNDERIPLDPVSFEDLNAGNGGQITNMVGPINNTIYVSKTEQLYKLVRTNNRQRAYLVVPVSKTVGAVEGSMVEGTDETGAACVYFLDPFLGAHRLGQFGLQYVGQDVWPLWNEVNLDSFWPVSAFYYTTEGQVIWTYASGTGFNDGPDGNFVFNVEHGRTTESGDVRKGWAVYTGAFSTRFFCGAMYAEDMTADERSAKLVPWFGLSGPSVERADFDGLMRGDTGNTDDGETYRAYIVTKPTIAGQTTLQKTEVKVGQLVGPVASGVTLAFRAWADFGTEKSGTVLVDMTATTRELETEPSRVLRYMDNLSLADCRTTQIEFGDPDDSGNEFWQLDRADIALVKNEMMGGGG